MTLLPEYGLGCAQACCLLTKWESPVVEHQIRLDPDTVMALDLHLSTTLLSPMTLL